MKILYTLVFLLLTGTAFSQEANPPAEKQKEETFVPDETTDKPAQEKADGIYTFVDQQAEFPGGKEALQKFLAENLVYPQSAVDLSIQGKCFVMFVVSKKGKIGHITIKRGVTDCPECDAEVIRVLKKMPKWKPARVDGKKVDCYFNLPVSFSLV
jgi:periplasmic protein TonB